MLKLNTLKTILYYSIFDYPLKIEEILEFSDNIVESELQASLDYLINKGAIFKNGLYYSITDDQNLTIKRENANAMADSIMPKARSKAHLISNFPFVEGVAFSGSLAKNYFDENSDIDFFIITKPNRLWIARTLLVLYKKVFLLNSRKYFCVNYFISSDNLVINDRNRFTATELVTLIPYSGAKHFINFINENNWAFEFFNNFKRENLKNTVEIKTKPLLSRGIEKLFENKLGEKFDEFFKTITVKKWRFKFEGMERKQFDIAMRSTKSVSKHHPQNFQKLVIDKLNVKIEKYNKKFDLNLTLEDA
jgi:predicted nucleotidyltransferase